MTYSKGYLGLLSTVGAFFTICTCCAPFTIGPIVRSLRQRFNRPHALAPDSPALEAGHHDELGRTEQTSTQWASEVENALYTVFQKHLKPQYTIRASGQKVAEWRLERLRDAFRQPDSGSLGKRWIIHSRTLDWPSPRPSLAPRQKRLRTI